MGVVGNKGSCAIRITVGRTKLAFISAHLAAHSKYCARRNADFHDILRRIKWDKGGLWGDADAVFFLGDLNYRVDLPNQQVRKLIVDGDLLPLLQHDQVHRSGGGCLTKAAAEGAESWTRIWGVHRGADQVRPNVQV